MRSVLEPNHQIDENHWVVSLVAKPHGRSPEHAFILVEGMVQDAVGVDQMVFRRYDFVTESSANIVPGFLEEKLEVVKRHRGIVVLKEHRCVLNDEDQENVFWAIMLKDIAQVEGCQGISWRISAEKANTLQINMKAARENPPDYHLSGQHAFFAASSSQSGHNCYTFARQQLLALGEQTMSQDKRLAVTLGDLLISITTRHLVPPTPVLEPSSSSCRIL